MDQYKIIYTIIYRFKNIYPVHSFKCSYVIIER